MKSPLAWRSGLSLVPWLSQRLGWLIDVPGNVPRDRALGRALAFCEVLVSRIGGSMCVFPGDECELVTITLPLDQAAVVREAA